MQIWVDADACPAVIKDILFRAADRRRIKVTLVANQLMRTPPSPYIKSLQVPAGFDEADSRIAQLVQPGDLVITADIPLAAQVLERGAAALNPRGELYTVENIREVVALRNFMAGLRASGVETGGPPPFAASDRQTFANRLDRLLSQAHKA